MKISSIQLLRGVAAVFVVLSHALITIGSQTASVEVPNALLGSYYNLATFGSSGVDVFFVISGFIMVLTTYKFWENGVDIKLFIIKRLSRIYPIWWFFLVITIVIMLLRGALQGSTYVGDVFALESEWLLRSFFLLPTYKPNGGFGPILGLGWTLIFEVYFYTIFTLCLLFKGYKILVILTIYFLLSVLCGFFYESSNVFFKVMTHPLLLEFILGCWTAFLCINKRFVRPKLAVFLLFIGLMVLCSSIFFDLFGGKLDSLRVIYWGIPSVLIVYSLVVLEFEKRISVPCFLSKLGDASYSIYLSHSAITFKVVGFSFFFFGLHSKVPADILVFILVTISCAVGIFSFKYIETKMTAVSFKYLEKIFLSKNTGKINKKIELS
jgi:exopolysaccharide production protein ExoZ